MEKHDTPGEATQGQTLPQWRQWPRQWPPVAPALWEVFHQTVAEAYVKAQLRIPEGQSLPPPDPQQVAAAERFVRRMQALYYQAVEQGDQDLADMTRGYTEQPYRAYFLAQRGIGTER